MTQNPMLSLVGKRLLPDEEMLASAIESNVNSTGPCGYVIASNKRLLLFRPSNDGTTQLFRTFYYSDIQKLLHKTVHGSSQIWITTRNGEGFFFENLEKIAAYSIANTFDKMRSNLT